MQATVAEPWDMPEVAKAHWFVHFLPSLTDFAFLLPPFLLFRLMQGTQHLLSDGDTGWQIRTGDWILQNGAVPHEDLFSFTKPHQAWFAWEWGADVVLSLLHHAAGLPGVAFATVLLLGLISALLFRLIRRVAGNDILSFGFTVLAVCGSVLHWLARPHLFTWFFALLFAHALLTAERGNRKPLFWLPLAMLFWTNLHGGFFIGIALLLASAAGAAMSLIQREMIQREMSQREMSQPEGIQLGEIQPSGAVLRNAYRSARPYLLCALACSAVTFVNPYGWHLHQHVAAYLLNSKLLDNIQEYQSLNFRQPGAIFFEGLLLLGVASVFWCLRRAKYAAGLTVLLWVHLSLVSVRNLPIFCLLASPWITAMCGDALHRAKSLPWLRKRNSNVLSEIVREFQPLERMERWHVASAAAVVLLALAFGAGLPGFESRFSAKTFPVAAMPALAASHPARLFTTDQWGDYLLYQFFPTQRVFMDGRSDFYGYDLMTKYEHIIDAKHDWERKLDQFSIDTVLVSPEAAIASVMKESPRWRILADGGSYILFQKREPVRIAHETAPPTDKLIAVRRPEGANYLFGAAQPTNLVPLPKLHERRSL